MHRDEQDAAIDLLGKVGTDDARQALLGVFGSNDNALAASAAAALAALAPDARTKAALVAAAENNSAVRAEVMSGLISAGDATGLQLARQVLEGQDPDLSAKAIQALAASGSPEGKELIGRAFGKSDPTVKARCNANAGGPPPARASTDQLVRFLHDSDTSVRTGALTLLGQVGSERAQDAVIAAARGSTSDERVAAVSAFANLEDPRASQQLPQLMDDPDPKVAGAAVSAAQHARCRGRRQARADRPPQQRPRVAHIGCGAGAQPAGHGEPTRRPRRQFRASSATTRNSVVVVWPWPSSATAAGPASRG